MVCVKLHMGEVFKVSTVEKLRTDKINKKAFAILLGHLLCGRVRWSR